MLCMGVMLYAQKVSRTYQDVSMSDVLRDLNEASDDYTVHFMYNELEDFRVTTKIHRKSIPDAIQQAIGFYPIRIVKRGENELYVECIQKTETRYKGTIVDEQGQPVAYANIALLSPLDSTLITGGVSNESGIFVIPCEQQPVLARISFVGYKTIFKQCNGTDIGTIRMQPETITLKGVTVKGQRLLYTATDRGLQVSIQGTPLEQFGSVSEMLSHLPLMMSNGEIAGHGAEREIEHFKACRYARIGIGKIDLLDLNIGLLRVLDLQFKDLALGLIPRRCSGNHDIFAEDMPFAVREICTVVGVTERHGAVDQRGQCRVFAGKPLLEVRRGVIARRTGGILGQRIGAGCEVCEGVGAGIRILGCRRTVVQLEDEVFGRRLAGHHINLAM